MKYLHGEDWVSWEFKRCWATIIWLGVWRWEFDRHLMETPIWKSDGPLTTVRRTSLAVGPVRFTIWKPVKK